MGYEIEFNVHLGCWEVVRTTSDTSETAERFILRAKTYLEAEDEALDLLMVDRYESDNSNIGSEFDHM